MTPYRNPHAALNVGQIIKTHLTKSKISYIELANLMGVKEAKIIYFATGRHYVPVEFAKSIAEALAVDPGELIYSILLQYFPQADVDAIWETIATDVLRRQRPTESDPYDERRENRKKKKRKKSR